MFQNTVFGRKWVFNDKLRGKKTVVLFISYDSKVTEKLSFIETQRYEMTILRYYIAIANNGSRRKCD